MNIREAIKTGMNMIKNKDTSIVRFISRVPMVTGK